MALETLKGVEKIGGFGVYALDEFGVQEFPVVPGDTFIEVNRQTNSISFKIQNGPIKENGVNGCQIDTIIEAAKKILEGLNQKFPCGENETAIENLNSALATLGLRRKNREERGVEGFNKA